MVTRHWDAPGTGSSGFDSESDVENSVPPLMRERVVPDQPGRGRWAVRAGWLRGGHVAAGRTPASSRPVGASRKFAESRLVTHISTVCLDGSTARQP